MLRDMNSEERGCFSPFCVICGDSFQMQANFLTFVVT